MKILSCIFTHGHGSGGHYYSFETINEHLKRNGIEICKLECGWNRSPVVTNSEYIYFNVFNFLSVIIKLIKIIRVEQVDIIHCYDELSFFLLKFVSMIKRKPIVLTRCGGPNPNFLYPVASNLICFSKENYDFFLGKYGINEIALIPNRCAFSPLDFNKYSNDFDKSNLKVLSIARIGKEYFSKHWNAISLLESSESVNIAGSITIVGSIEDNLVYKELCAYAEGKNVTFITDPKTTKNASQLIDLFDVVVGTGRGCMEAMARGKPVILIDQKHEIPFMLTPDNFKDCFEMNFSLRVDGRKYRNNFSNADLKQLSKWSKDIYDSHFSVDSGIAKYHEFYNKVRFKYRASDIVNITKGLINSVYFYFLYIKKSRPK
ncbi:hypothetical protein ACLFLD_04365 [Providencia hangzhouensis]|uniref:hypothetical protein n=1 Tax=Providencia TaxID=586 RepID=UPI002349DCD8|nr:hypothetical protein [Providencia sp. PROV270]